MCRIVGCLCEKPPAKLAPRFLPEIEGSQIFGSRNFLPMEVWLHVNGIIRTQFIARARKKFVAEAQNEPYWLVFERQHLRITRPVLQITNITWLVPTREIHYTYATHFRKLCKYGDITSCIVLIWRVCIVAGVHRYTHFCMKVAYYVTGAEDERYYTCADF